MPKAPNAIEMLQKDHKLVQTLFRRFQRSKDEREQRDIMVEACAALEQHAELEEEAFYPYVREATGWDELMAEAEVEHASARSLIEQIGKTRDRDRRHALFTVLGEYTRHHIQEEEERIFPLVMKTGLDLEAFGEELVARRESLGTGRGARRQPQAAAPRAEPKARTPQAEADDDYAEPTQQDNEAS